ncbi:CD209 antigen-like protein E isoform X1 [Salvelinus sp. IW2-2015]|uniref:CD209 antigen-like protein E isoform X1 n=1 Tax=Salvelinus sp. IW2-2015 TaxID=2691554 RepID=UPI000CDFB923|nr:CD209 antigen-like protein E isoform X1 [Salvelinus alpinus]
MENIYANISAETVMVLHDPNIETQDVTSSGMAGRQQFAKSNHLKVAVVCLGLLCVLLLTGIIGLCVHYNGVAGDFEEEQTKLLTETDQLKGEIDNLQNKLLFMEHHFKMGWCHFGSSFYLFSTVGKTWEQSKHDCVRRGADLVIIDSREEQNFIIGFNGMFWIGLSDRETEGSWKWVDGTPLTIQYWKSGEPNSYGGEEDCAERSLIYSNTEQSWNDAQCGQLKLGICEKVAYP